MEFEIQRQKLKLTKKMNEQKLNQKEAQRDAQLEIRNKLIDHLSKPCFYIIKTIELNQLRYSFQR